MTTAITSSLNSWSNTINNNHLAFRDFANAWSQIFSASGWINTNASGSVNLSQISASGYNQISGYQVWRFNDELHHNGYPVYVKVEYGSPLPIFQNLLDSYGGFWLSVGFQHNGSGSISPTGVVGVGSTPRVPVSYSTDNGVTNTHFACCISGSDFVGLPAIDLQYESPLFAVERIKDRNGNPTTDGVLVYSANGSFMSHQSSGLLYSDDLNTVQPTLSTYPILVYPNRHACYRNFTRVAPFRIVLHNGVEYVSQMAGVSHLQAHRPGITHNLKLFGAPRQYYISINDRVQNLWLRRTTYDYKAYRWIIRFE